MSDSTPCASCPFRSDNFEQFKEVVNKIAKRELDFFEVEGARANVIRDGIENGLGCHCTKRTDGVPCEGLEQYRKGGGADVNKEKVDSLLRLAP